MEDRNATAQVGLLTSISWLHLSPLCPISHSDRKIDVSASLKTVTASSVGNKTINMSQPKVDMFLQNAGCQSSVHLVNM